METNEKIPRTPRRRSSAATAEPSRKASSGDTVGVRKTQKVKQAVVRKTRQAAQGAQVAALQDIVSHADDKALALKTFLKGSSPEDIAEVRRLLRGGNGKYQAGLKPDEELARDWRKGVYPYKNLLSRKRYESQKYSLQVELLKLQAWVKETRQRVVKCNNTSVVGAFLN